MSNRNHPDLPFYPYFVTTTVYDRAPVFADPRAAALFVDELFVLRSELRFLLPAYVVMADHVHMVVVPHPYHSLAHIMQRVKGRYARRYHQQFAGEGRLWQPRYYERVVDSDASFARSVAYVEDNPVAGGLATSASAYAYSSAFRPTGDLEGYLSGDAMVGWPDAPG